MINQMLKYKGYSGQAWVDFDAKVIRGHVIGTRDVITFQGSSVDEVCAEFVTSVDDYLAFCAEIGRTPEKPFSGKLLVRVDPNLHRQLSESAEKSGKSLNSMVVDKLTERCIEEGVEKAFREKASLAATPTRTKALRQKKAKSLQSNKEKTESINPKAKSQK